jgi:hypothetical protein
MVIPRDYHGLKNKKVKSELSFMLANDLGPGIYWNNQPSALTFGDQLFQERPSPSVLPSTYVQLCVAFN